MSDTPERIWAKTHTGKRTSGYWQDEPIFPNMPENIGTEYVRAMEWQPIATAPRGVYILVCQSQNAIIVVARGVNENGCWRTGPGPMDYIAGVTHWMPLPEPPCAPRPGRRGND